MPPLSPGLEYFLVGALGLILGSFANVVVARLPLEMSVAHPASHCPSCRKPIRWWDNIPVLSYLALRGRCRQCQAPISVRYPIIELLTGLLCVAARYRFGMNATLFVRDIPLLVILVCVTFIDLEHRIIPDRLSLGGLVLGLATAWMDGRLGEGALPAFVQGAIGAAVGFGVFYAFAWTYFQATGRSGLGGGDIKLLAMLGAFLGPLGVFQTILISSVFGSVVGIGWALATRKRNLMTVAIPYGPFLVVGALYYDLLGGELPWLRFMIPT